MAHLSLSFLGPFQATLDGRPVSGFESAKVRALLAYLAVEADHPHPRESVAGLLWPDWPQPSALRNLREALTNLRRILGQVGRPSSGNETPPFLLANRQTLQFNAASDHDLDVAALAAAARQARTNHSTVEALEQAVARYRGPFLEGLAVDSASFEQWITLQRERVVRDYLAVLHALTTLHEQAGAIDQVLLYARKQVEVEPLDEEGHRQFMRALALGGQRNAALSHYEACRELLARELGVEPAPETTALYEQIRCGTPVASPPPTPTRNSFPRSEPTSLSVESPGLPVIPSPRPLFVAREEELAHLERWLEEALRGQGRVGFVVGEPGSGKTMLLREFARRAMETHPGLLVAGGACNAYGGIGDPYLPFLELLQTLLGDIEARRAVGGISPEHARRLRAATPLTLGAVLQWGPSLVDALLSGTMLRERARSLAEDAPWEARVQDALDHRSAIPSQALFFEQITRVLQEIAKSRPLLLTLDDLQWSDTTSIGLLFHLGRRVAGHPILVLGAYRPEEVTAGREGEPHPLAPVVLELGALWEESDVDLAQAKGRAFVDALVDSEPNHLGTGFRQALYRHTGGHALFTVELLRGLQQRGDLVQDAQGLWVAGPTLDWESLPRRVEAVIAAHIARLSREEQELLSVASVEGEEFHAEVAARVLRRSEAEVFHALSGALGQEHGLVRAQSVHRAGGQRFSRYRFRHYLFQHYLHRRLDPVRRVHLHGEAAAALEELGAVQPGHFDWQNAYQFLADEYEHRLAFAEGIVSEGTMAWHWEEAARPEPAALYHVRAFMRLSSRAGAWEETLWHIKRAQGLFAMLPDGPRRMRYECLCYDACGVIVRDNRGWADAEAGELLRKGLELAEQIGDPLLLSFVLSDIASTQRLCGEIGLALSLHQRALELAQGGPPAWVGYLQGELAMTLLFRGDLSPAVSLWQPLVDGLLNKGPSTADRLLNLEHMTWALWCLGFPDRALRLSQAIQQVVVQRRGELSPFAEMMVFSAAVCFTHQLRRETESVEDGARRLHVSMEGRRNLFGEAVGEFYQGWVHTRRGLLEQGLEEMRSGLAYLFQYQVAERPYLGSYLAEALARAGRVEEGLHILEEGLAQTERTGERWSEAELWRLKGELLLQRKEPSSPALLPQMAWEKGEDVTAASTSSHATAEEAEGCYRRAIEVAQRQEARSWELRATTSLARLLQSQGRADEAREMLSAIYNWFTEGFDTPDLIEAKAVLETLQKPSRLSV